MAIQHFKTSEFDAAVEAAPLAMVDFWADWCGPCKMLSPVVDSIAEEHPEIKICKIDIDEEPSLTERFGIMSVPTLVVMKNGEIVRTSVGFKSRDAVLSLLAE